MEAAIATAKEAYRVEVNIVREELDAARLKLAHEHALRLYAGRQVTTLGYLRLYARKNRAQQQAIEMGDLRRGMGVVQCLEIWRLWSLDRLKRLESMRLGKSLEVGLVSRGGGENRRRIQDFIAELRQRLRLLWGSNPVCVCVCGSPNPNFNPNWRLFRCTIQGGLLVSTLLSRRGIQKLSLRIALKNELHKRMLKAIEWHDARALTKGIAGWLREVLELRLEAGREILGLKRMLRLKEH